MNRHSHQNPITVRWALLLCLVLATLVVYAADVPPADVPPVAAPPTAQAKTDLNVLFIGNSMTWFCNMPRTVAELAEQMDPPVHLHAALAVGACNTLANPHVKEGSGARRAIAGDITGYLKEKAVEITWLQKTLAAEPDNAQNKADLARLQADAKALAGKPKWDVVVLQPWGGEDVKDAAAFAANVKILQDDITKSFNVKILQDDITKSLPDARVIMYMEPTRRMDNARGEKVVRNSVLPAYRQLMVSNKVEVAPAALAGALICKEKPDYWLKITKLPNDAHHGLRGAYAVASTIFATIFDRSPEGLPVHRMEAHYTINGTVKPKDGGHKITVEGKTHMEYFSDGPVQMLSDEDMKFIQGKAWAAVQEWKLYSKVEPAKP